MHGDPLTNFEWRIEDRRGRGKKFVFELVEPFMRWPGGYRDGVAALVVLDKRLDTLPRDPYLLGALVLSSCHAKPDRTIGEVANEVFEKLLNREPGKRLKLGVARP
jgi:hypothetical protein